MSDFPAKQASTDWLAHPDFRDVVVLDPDGWDRSRFDESMAEVIDRAEFENRLAMSTTLHTPSPSPMR